jgi:GTPase
VQDYVEVRVAVVGNVDSGKSTLVGVLAMGGGTLDNGRGLMRGTVFRHRHERVSGRTSSISERVMGFDSKGNRIDTSAAHSRDKKKSTADKSEADKPKENYGLKEVQAATQMVVESCSKIVTLVDLAGHAKYLKTTVLGLTGRVSDYCCVVVGANMGVLKMTKEHIGCALALRVPSFFVLTKTDICPPNVLQETLDNLVKLLKSQGVRKLPYVIRTMEDVLVCVRQLTSAGAIKLAPIFVTSNVTGDGMDLLFQFMNLLPASPVDTVPETNGASNDCEFRVDEVFFVPRVGPVVSGVLTRGAVHLNAQLMLGPDGSGKFHQVQVRGIHRHRQATDSVCAKRAVTFALKGAPMGTGKRAAIRRGMVLTSCVGASDRPISCRRFEAEVVILHHPTTIEVNYQPVVHCAGVRQAVRVVAIRKGSPVTEVDDEDQGQDSVVLRTGDSARVDFEFMLRPECIAVHSRLLFLEGRTKGVGKVTHVYPISA